MALALLLIVLLVCALERRPAPPRQGPPATVANPPRRGRRLDRWSLPAARLLQVGAWSFTFAELASGRFPLAGLMAVGLFTLIGSVVVHEMRTYDSPAELALVPVEDEPERGAVSRR
jgi:hypothetical protein